jgi:hypothetical protein
MFWYDLLVGLHLLLRIRRSWCDQTAASVHLLLTIWKCLTNRGKNKKDRGKFLRAWIIFNCVLVSKVFKSLRNEDILDLFWWGFCWPGYWLIAFSSSLPMLTAAHNRQSLNLLAAALIKYSKSRLVGQFLWLCAVFLITGRLFVNFTENSWSGFIFPLPFLVGDHDSSPAILVRTFALPGMYVNWISQGRNRRGCKVTQLTGIFQK